MTLQRFIDAQADQYAQAEAELALGRKTSHWMWYIFPQIAGLGHSQMAQRYAIADLDEAKAYLAHPMLGDRLRHCATLLLAIDNKNAREVLGSPDDLKLRSSMTLFDQAAKAGATDDTVFAQVLDTYYQGKPDQRTLAILDG